MQITHKKVSGETNVSEETVGGEDWDEKHRVVGTTVLDHLLVQIVGPASAPTLVSCALGYDNAGITEPVGSRLAEGEYVVAFDMADAEANDWLYIDFLWVLPIYIPSAVATVEISHNVASPNPGESLDGYFELVVSTFDSGGDPVDIPEDEMVKLMLFCHRNSSPAAPEEP